MFNYFVLWILVSFPSFDFNGASCKYFLYKGMCQLPVSFYCGYITFIFFLQVFMLPCGRSLGFLWKWLCWGSLFSSLRSVVPRLNLMSLTLTKEMISELWIGYYLVYKKKKTHRGIFSFSFLSLFFFFFW